MRKVAIAQHAIERLRQLAPADQERAAEAIERLRSAKDVVLNMIATPHAPQMYTMRYKNLVIVFRQLRDQLVVLSVFKRREIKPREKLSPRNP